ncbi:ArsR/SmtB family transcription factor [Arthrobacter rhizosphaerae]|uniref:ArsR/SmtB family transcription factor n=1 Tax=Arthrobacter rhizosphaerae TaxID=2855490 RepID=UPI001FF19BBF|nr:metalloregulator ArsR/SmtB family transcription factor [Arthrobacter rhizosphaerae]
MVTDDVFAVIAEATRRDILVSLRAGDKAVGELVQELEASQPTISKHLKVLREADLVTMRAQGQKRYYTLNPQPLIGIANWLETFDVGHSTAAGMSPAAEGAAVSETEGLPAAQRPGSAEAGLAAAVSSEAQSVSPRSAQGQLSPAVAIPVGVGPDGTVPQQIGRTVGRAAAKASDLLSNLPKFGRKK